MLKARFTVDRIWTTPSQSSAAMEPHASIAAWDGDRLTLHGSYQVVAHNRLQLADALGVKPDKVRLVARYVGGWIRIEARHRARNRRRRACARSKSGGR